MRIDVEHASWHRICQVHLHTPPEHLGAIHHHEHDGAGCEEIHTERYNFNAKDRQLRGQDGVLRNV